MYLDQTRHRATVIAQNIHLLCSEHPHPVLAKLVPDFPGSVLSGSPASWEMEHAISIDTTIEVCMFVLLAGMP